MRDLHAVVLVALFLIAPISAGAQSNRSRDVDFGVNGHPLNPGSYSDMSLEQQVDLVKRLHLRTYRVNINPTHSDKFARLSQLIVLAQREHIRVLPVIVLPAKQYSDEDSAYHAAREAMHMLAKQFDTKISVWELGNEYDLYCVKSGADGGSQAGYDPAKYAVVRGLINGMLAGLREGSPSSRSIVETSQRTSTSLDSGFLQKLFQDGVKFDITGYHYYSRSGRVPTAGDGKNSLQVLHDSFHKPIWITEFDESAINSQIGPNADPQQQGEALTAALNEIAADASRFDVIGADIYELLDEPELLHTPGGVNPCQSEFGILYAHGNMTDASRAVEEFLR